jgi:hypothetical protein
MNGTPASGPGRVDGTVSADAGRAAPRAPGAWPLLLLPSLLAPAAAITAAIAPGRFLLPLLATLAIHPCMALLIVRGRRGAAAGATLLWAASLSASIIVLSARDPAAMGDRIVHGPAYRDEMFAFIRAGAGRESDPARFLPQHALHLGAFALASAASGGLLGIAMGSVLVAYMSYYVGALAAAGGAPGIAFLLGWPPWGIVRVIAYILLGVGLAGPLLATAARRRIPFPGRTTWYLAAAGLLLLDAALKWLLAPAWAALLRPCLVP